MRSRERESVREQLEFNSLIRVRERENWSQWGDRELEMRFERERETKS